MTKKGRVIHTWKGGELFIENDNLEEKITFSLSNGMGFTASSIKEMEILVKGTESIIKQFWAKIDDFKDATADKAPALLGYEDYMPRSEIKRLEAEKNADKILSKMKSFIDDKNGEVLI